MLGIYSINLPDRVDDFIDPTLVTIGVCLLVSLFYLLTRPVVDRRLSLKATSTERRIAELRAREIVRRHGRGTLDYFALRDDKQFFFFRDSLVAYAVYGGVALISPDPIDLPPNAPRSSAPFAPTASHAVGPSVSWPPARNGHRSTTRLGCTPSTWVTRRSSTARPSHSRAVE